MYRFTVDDIPNQCVSVKIAVKSPRDQISSVLIFSGQMTKSLDFVCHYLFNPFSS